MNLKKIYIGINLNIFLRKKKKKKKGRFDIGFSSDILSQNKRGRFGLTYRKIYYLLNRVLMRSEVTFMKIMIFSKLKKGILWKKPKKTNKQTKTKTKQNTSQST